MAFEVDRTCFTVVFEGDIGKLPFNPMAKHDTPFGRVVGCGFGNAFSDMEDAIDSAFAEEA